MTINHTDKGVFIEFSHGCSGTLGDSHCLKTQSKRDGKSCLSTWT